MLILQTAPGSKLNEIREVLLNNSEARYPSKGRCPASKTLFLPAKSFKYDRYLSNLRSKIESNWSPSIKDSTLAVELSFTIQKNGTLSGLSITKKSGKTILDTQAKRAVQMAFPMPKLPQGYSGNSLALIYTLVPFKN